jgi:hypothetical protein
MVMKILAAAIVTCLICPGEPSRAATSSSMRPYSGIGILMLAVAADSDNGHAEPLNIYKEPAISRQGILKSVKVPRYELVFGKSAATVILIVTARKGDWLRVVYDDAGREAWLNPQRRGPFRPWDEFLKGQSCRLLAGVPKQYYQLYQQPGKGLLGPMTARQAFKVVKLQYDWALVMPDQNTLGWMRWRDDDGRLLISVEMVPDAQSP